MCTGKKVCNHTRLILWCYSLCLKNECYYSGRQRSSRTGACEVVAAFSIQICGGLHMEGGREGGREEVDSIISSAHYTCMYGIME